MNKNRILTFLLLLIMIPCAVCQSYFTVPQNVWRVSIASNSMFGDWIGDNGVKEVGQDNIGFLFGMDSTMLTELRKILPVKAPIASRSAVNLARPVILSGPSIIAIRRPTGWAGPGALSIIAPPPGPLR